jgi:predicted choloylglycine hydrolase
MPELVTHYDRACAPKFSSAALTRSLERQQSILAALEDRTMTLERLTAKFFKPPLYSRREGFTTVYSAVYFPAEGRVDYLWPGKSLASASTTSLLRNSLMTTGSYYPDHCTCRS